MMIATSLNDTKGHDDQLHWKVTTSYFDILTSIHPHRCTWS